MLKSKFSKPKNGFRAQKVFTDRIVPRDVFAASIKEYRDRPQEIIDYYGIGGIGKTTLLKKLHSEADVIYLKSGLNINSIFLSLDAYDYGNPVNILMSIRNGVQGDCSLFDYALVQYCSKAKLTIDEIKNQNKLLSSPIVDILNEALSIGTSSACIPASIMKNCINFFKDMAFKERFKEEILEMNGLNEFDLFERLPYYLGLCISRLAEKGVYHVVFLDSYESMLKRTISTTPSIGNEDWLKELFLSSEYIRIVIASRDRLGWEREDSEWAEYLNCHLIYNLSENDSKWFLSNVPIKDEAIVDKIARLSGGVPLYLDMCVDIYEDSMNNNKEFDIMALNNGEKIIDRYIRHLERKDKYAVKVLSVLRCFDAEFAIELLKLENLYYSAEELEELLQKSIFLSMEGADGLWKVDESVRLHLRAKMEDKKLGDTLLNVLKCISCEDSGKGFQYFAAVLEIVMEHPVEVPGMADMLFERLDYFANSGYWNELHTLLGDIESSADPLLRAIGVYEELVWCRRTGQLAAGKEFIERYPVQKDDMGVWFFMYRYLTVQINHLMGDYDRSIVGYKSLLDEMNPIKSEIPRHIYNTVCMKYADLLFLRGEFDTALGIVEELLQDRDISIYDKIELLRIKGHIYRFQHKYMEAETVYSTGIRLIRDRKLLAFEQKLYTNMAETLCTVRPEEALTWYEKSAEINSTIENDIELGKALAAASAAYTTMGECGKGVEYGLAALDTAKKTGYRSGQAFAHAALAYAYEKSGDSGSAEASKETLAALIEELNVYRYIKM